MSARERLARFFRPRRTETAAVPPQWRLHAGENGAVGVSLHAGAEMDAARQELNLLVPAIRKRGAAS